MLTCDMLVDHGDIPGQNLHDLNLMMLTKAVGKERLYHRRSTPIDVVLHGDHIVCEQD